MKSMHYVCEICFVFRLLSIIIYFFKKKKGAALADLERRDAQLASTMPGIVISFLFNVILSSLDLNLNWHHVAKVLHRLRHLSHSRNVDSMMLTRTLLCLSLIDV